MNKNSIDVNLSLPFRITAGVDNVLFHYVQVEVGEAYLLAPTNSINGIVIEAFKRSCLLIHTVLQNTLK